MNLRQLLREIKCLPRDLELYIHEVGKGGLASFQPLKGVSWNISDKKLSFGTKDFNMLMHEAEKRHGFFKK